MLVDDGGVMCGRFIVHAPSTEDKLKTTYHAKHDSHFGMLAVLIQLLYTFNLQPEFHIITRFQSPERKTGNGWKMSYSRIKLLVIFVYYIVLALVLFQR